MGKLAASLGTGAPYLLVRLRSDGLTDRQLLSKLPEWGCGLASWCDSSAAHGSCLVVVGPCELAPTAVATARTPPALV